MSKNKISIILGAVCLIMTIAIVIQIKTVKGTGIDVNISNVENELRDEVLKWKEKYDNASKELTKAEKKLEEQRKKATKNDETSKSNEQELKVGNCVLGLTAVSGQGIEITLKDNQSITSETAIKEISEYLVHDIDILSIVNELKNAGAEAISINGERIISTTSITCAGNVAQINGEKVGAPFVIKAIGNSSMLYEALKRPGGYINEYLEPYIVVDVKKSNNITIEKYNGTLNFKYVKDV